MLSESKRLEEQIKSLEEQIKTLPEGDFFCAHNGKYYKWYQTEIYYWEHFGKMDDPIYTQNVFSKLQLYTAHNIIPSINLITTYETKDSPLSSDMIEKIIEYYFN